MLKRVNDVNLNLDFVGVEVEIYVEGYRPSKDVWLHNTLRFNTVKEAEDFIGAFRAADWKDQSFLLDLKDTDDGVYGRSYEYFKAYEYTSEGGKFELEWKRE